MTNAHVVSGARRVEVVLPAANADGTLASALSGKTYTSPGTHRRRDHRARPGAAEDRRPEAAGAPAGHLLASPAGRDGVCVWQPDRHAQQPVARARLAGGPTGGSRFAADLRPDRRADQPRKLRRPAGQHPRRSRGRQHLHRVAVRRQRRAGLRDPERDDPDRLPSAEAVWPVAPAGNRGELPDHHVRHGGGARAGEELWRHRLGRLASRPGRGGRD